ncbi:MAG TPA: hypothetical protein VLA19_25005, partial [Herpetosiphonaceae bacterium]|nr:hypothetical protein [Herpetosiphonaceae bacterium]
MERTHRHRLFVVAGLFALALLLTPSVAAILRPDGVHAAWERARSAGSYRFDGDVVQVTTPSATVGNVGRASREERLHLEGDTNSRARTLEMRLWARDGSAAQDESGVAVRVADGKTSIRQGSGAWKDAGDVTGTVAPQGDFMAYLGAVRDVKAHAPETRAGVAFTRYTFRLDGPAFATYMRDQTEAALARQGELPPGTRIETPKALAKMAGQGELWVGRDGLPLRQIIDVAFPEQGSETVSARITINFSRFGAPVVSWLGTGIVSRTVSDLLYDPFPLYQMLLWSVVAVLLVRFRRSRRLQEGMALVVVAALVLGPVLSGLRVDTFLGVQSAKAAEQEQAQQESDMQQTLRKIQAENAFDPHADPMASTMQAVDSSTQPASAAGTIDGPASALAAAAPAQVVSNDGTDTDSDGLSDYLEERLGTEPSVADSDDDGVDDGVEVRGFSFDGKQWYGDPQNVDSNGDTLGDGQEWFTDANNDGTPDDTDGDKAPDLFDADNDGDGVPDSKDTSPVSHSLMAGGAGAPFSESTPFKLSMQDIAQGMPTYVDFQLRPTDDKHLWFAHNVLDWPLDSQAQILDQDNATWADRAAAEGRAAEENESNGDLKLVPMLEIRMAGPANLPTQADLTPYNISVNELADFPTQGSTGRVAYVPLTMVADDQTGARVAFNGRMLYRPGASWGTPDQVRLVWLVQALVDKCKQFTDGLCTEWEEPLNQPQVLQTYYDEWTLTGLSVREDNGVKMATIYENPTAEAGGVADADLNDDTPLWMLAGGLDGSFLAGRDEGNNGRDVTIDEIYNRFNR